MAFQSFAALRFSSMRVRFSCTKCNHSTV